MRFDPAAVARDLQHPAGPPTLPATMERSVEQKHAAQRQVPWRDLRRQAHDIKAYAIAHLDKLLAQFEREFERRGGTVVWAATARDAANAFVEICRTHGATTVVKGKSMVSEELDLNERLSDAGIDALETDLGEFIVQLAGQRPSHVIGPALHLSRGDVAALFQSKLGIPRTDDSTQLVAAARAHLRAKYLRSEVGMTGANFLIADTGSVVVVENEGNGGLCAAAPPVHVVLAGIEKVIPSVSDVAIFLQLLARAGTGQKITSYTHHFSGPEPGKTMYCILVDAGRTSLLADPRTRESLYCIRCGACLNVCPIYRRVGGWAYGGAYAGPIGSVVTPKMIGTSVAGELPFASTLCGACREECPVDIDLPHQLVSLRSRVVENGSPAGRKNAAFFRRWCAAMMTARAYGRAIWWARLGTIFARISPVKPGFLGAWASSRSLPSIPRQTFKEWWRRRS